MANVRTTSVVNITISTNVWWTDTFRFGCTEESDECCAADVDTTWDFNGKTFAMDLRPELGGDETFSLTTENGRIVVTDATNRILAFNVTHTDLAAALTVDTTYVYDLIMITTATGERTQLMRGAIEVNQGVTD